MNYLIEKVKQNWKIIFFGFLLLVLIVIIYLHNQTKNYENSAESLLIHADVTTSEIEKNPLSTIFVDIKGAVKKPGVYELAEGSRVIHAIEKSGGLNKGADTSNINLSKKLEDGNIIIIYTKDKIEQMKEQEIIIEYIEKECICPDEQNSACISKEDVVIEEGNNKPSKESNSTKIALNSATKEELMTLPGIGEAKAADILEYRESQGDFKTIEDIKNVKGIGESLFEKIKEYLTL